GSTASRRPLSTRTKTPTATLRKGLDGPINGRPPPLHARSAQRDGREGFQNGVHAAVRYSWMGPPRRSGRSIVFARGWLRVSLPAGGWERVLGAAAACWSGSRSGEADVRGGGGRSITNRDTRRGRYAQTAPRRHSPEVRALACGSP